MTRFRFLPEALTDLEEAGAWYEHQRPGLGAELFDEFDSCIAGAIETPGTGSLSGTTANGNEIRRYRLRRFRRYADLLSVIDGIPTVIAFEHSSRRPRYWKDRVK
jgi:toxin ParE1/3/4